MWTSKHQDTLKPTEAQIRTKYHTFCAIPMKENSGGGLPNAKPILKFLKQGASWKVNPRSHTEPKKITMW